MYPTTWASDEVQTVCGKEVMEELININVIIIITINNINVITKYSLLISRPDCILWVFVKLDGYSFLPSLLLVMVSYWVIYIFSCKSYLISLSAGGLSITLSLNEVKAKDHYYRDLTSSDHLGYPVFGSTGGLSQYGGYSGGQLGGHTNLGYSSDTMSMYGSKPAINSAIYMTPHMEEDRYVNH